MTDNDIIKAFIETYEQYNAKGDGRTFVYKEVLDLINRQKAEIERLESEYPCKVKCGNNCEIWAKSLSDYDNLIGDISSEGIKEFTEKLKENISIIYIGDNTPMRVVQEVTIDRILKEMGGVLNDM